LTGGTGLNRDKFMTQESARDIGRLRGTLHELHAVLLGIVLDRAFAAATRMDLRFDDGDWFASLDIRESSL
jgi:hypothetical protein